jgi:hypothetical protein
MRSIGPAGTTHGDVSRRVAREHFATEDVIGQRVVIDLGESVTAEIVGLAADVRIFGQGNDAPPMVYVPARQHPAAYLQAIVRSAMPTVDVASTIRRHVQSLDGALAPGRTERMDGLVADSVAEPRFAMLLIGSFAGLADAHAGRRLRHPGVPRLAAAARVRYSHCAGRDARNDPPDGTRPGTRDARLRRYRGGSAVAVHIAHRIGAAAEPARPGIGPVASSP